MYKDPCDYIESAWIIQNNLLLSGQLISNRSLCNLNSLLPRKLTCSQVLGMGPLLCQPQKGA